MINFNEMFEWNRAASWPSMEFDGVAVRDQLGATFQVLLKDIRVSWLDSFIIILFEINNFKAELLVKLDGAVVIHLDVPTKINHYEMDARVDLSLILTRICCQSFHQPQRTSKCVTTSLSQCPDADMDRGTQES